jgi:hypothetical protein
MTPRSALRYFPLVFTRVNKVYTTRRTKGLGQGDLPGPITEMWSDAGAHEDEKLARVVGDSDAGIVVQSQHPRAFPSHPVHDPRGG